mmetsp:Transcript_1016/g.2642  ORF Transcript_1016/g.2642 Transcript_1016/m.2642 type:complete len:260 (+) Transcript_1016:83-862(+)
MRRGDCRRRPRRLHVCAVHLPGGSEDGGAGQEPRHGGPCHHVDHRQLSRRRPHDERVGAARPDEGPGGRVRHRLPPRAGLPGGDGRRQEGGVHTRRDYQGEGDGSRHGSHGAEAVLQGRGHVPWEGRELLRDLRRRLLPRERGGGYRRQPRGGGGGGVPHQVCQDGALDHADRPQGRRCARAGAAGTPKRATLEQDGHGQRRGRRRRSHRHPAQAPGAGGDGTLGSRGCFHLRRGLEADHRLSRGPGAAERRRRRVGRR